nr:hypothetical protein [Chromobacterium sp. ASV5]
MKKPAKAGFFIAGAAKSQGQGAKSGGFIAYPQRGRAGFQCAGEAVNTGIGFDFASRHLV